MQLAAAYILAGIEGKFKENAKYALYYYRQTNKPKTDTPVSQKLLMHQAK
jgi:hypothetical protein